MPLALLTNPDSSPALFDVLRPQRLAAPGTPYVEQLLARILEADAAELYGPPDPASWHFGVNRCTIISSRMSADLCQGRLARPEGAAIRDGATRAIARLMKSTDRPMAHHRTKPLAKCDSLLEHSTI